MSQTGRSRPGGGGSVEKRLAGGFEVPILPRSAFQPMPPLTTEEYAALRADVEVHGVLVPVVVDQHGRLLDGHHRRRIAAELGIDCPTEVRTVVDDAEAWDLAVTLNAARRHLSREQRRELVRAELDRRPGDSDRAIARWVGCSPTTVGTVRAGASNLDTPDDANTQVITRAEAEACTAEIRRNLDDARDHIAVLVCLALASKIAPAEIVFALTAAQREHERHSERDVADLFRIAVFTPLIDAAMKPCDAKWDAEVFAPLDEPGATELLAAIASVGGPRC